MNGEQELENNKVDYRELPIPSAQELKPDKFVGGSSQEKVNYIQNRSVESPAVRKPSFPILDMDTESTAPKGPSLDELKEHSIKELLAEHAKEGGRHEPTEEELDAAAERRVALKDIKEKNERELHEGITEALLPFENFFSRKAAELHVVGKPHRKGIFGKTYEVEESTLDKDRNKEYPYKLRYRIEGKGADQQYIPESYVQGLTKGDERISEDNRLAIELQNGEIRAIAINDPNKGKRSKSLRIEFDRASGVSISTGLKHGSEFKFDAQGNEFRTWLEGIGHIKAPEFIQLTKEKLRLIPTKELT